MDRWLKCNIHPYSILYCLKSCIGMLLWPELLLWIFPQERLAMFLILLKPNFGHFGPSLSLIIKMMNNNDHLGSNNKSCQSWDFGILLNLALWMTFHLLRLSRVSFVFSSGSAGPSGQYLRGWGCYCCSKWKTLVANAKCWTNIRWQKRDLI